MRQRFRVGDVAWDACEHEYVLILRPSGEGYIVEELQYGDVRDVLDNGLYACIPSFLGPIPKPEWNA